MLVNTLKLSVPPSEWARTFEPSCQMFIVIPPAELWAAIVNATNAMHAFLKDAMFRMPFKCVKPSL